MKKKASGESETKGVSRREFGRQAAITLAGGALAGTAKPVSGLTLNNLPDAAPFAQEQAASGLSPEAQAELEAKLQHVLITYGSRLSDEQKKRMRQIITNHVRMLEAIRPMAVANGDAPATVLELITDAGAAKTQGES